ncbi:hypothetical protein [Amycolatopsis sp. Poz14]|uniref:hypothetical protein n=1 Tax=Amycolatopsis sp. Poz14 TaxID=1447705 RepID=UPI001EE89295|nr:hypothetical protein [Amycolatopsis sp. Poz14]MCG3756686.1 hypothetical protein [Amycolatopsis sp. Poz14]
MKTTDRAVEYGAAPIPPVTEADAVAAMECPDCIGEREVVPSTDTMPPLIKLTHDATCPRGRELARRQAAAKEDARKTRQKRKASKAARKATKRTDK